MTPFGPLLLALLSTLPGGIDAAAGDARLNGLCFVDAQRGWAVGDRGVICHTDDAGRSLAAADLRRRLQSSDGVLSQ